ncbi:PP2C family protein-serine/threonine phosphatase [Streptomyces glomeratus]|uniref:PP2C family protein-serine/threonine phosphatase n=1 Tax=Streptomyces glomeratus TaxID=284452 RepID=UPI001F40298E|nr:PP2C family protein-serine/threonine phosphatase [Streptomyces glomeratus]MCF1509766.1 serine/threonine-protein phosphatase [Streptomyces glomeratus]
MHWIGQSRLHPRPQGRWSPVLLSPVILTVVVTCLAFTTPRQVAFSRILTAAPALAASIWTVLPTVLLGAACLVIMIALSLVYPDLGTWYTVGAIAAVTLAAAYASHIRISREQALIQVRLVADAAQKVLLRPLPSRVGCVEIESMYLAAEAEARIGGDFYEAVSTPYGVRLLIGDVRGKGLPAVGAAAAVVNCFREAAYEESDLCSIVRRMEISSTRHIDTFPTRELSEHFTTVLLAEISPQCERLSLLNCGHPPPLIVQDGKLHVLDPTAPSPLLNLATLIGDHYSIDTITCTPGDQLLFYTDGIIESRNAKGEFFPLQDWMRRQTSARPRELLHRLHRDLLRHSGGGLDDDIAALAVRLRDTSTCTAGHSAPA